MEEALNKRTRVVDLLLVLAVAIGSAALTATFALFSLSPVTESSASVVYVANFVFHEIVALILLVYVLRRQGRDLRSIGVSPRWTDVPWSVVLAVGQLACYIGAFTIIATVLPPVTEATPESIAAMGAAPLALLAAMVLVNPVFEELIVRGYAATELTYLLGNRWVAGGLTVVVQSYYHVYQGTRHALAYAAGFAVLAVYFAVTRRVTPVILAHLYLDGYALYALASAARGAA